jgi:acetyl-CoA carboxylase biotin carboxyl carrier protein
LDLKQIKQIIDLMKRSELTDFAVEDGGFKLKIRRGPTGVPVVTQRSGGAASSFPTAEHAPVSSPVTEPATVMLNPGAPGADEPGVIFVKSPMVGTFYRAASAESPPFVEIGSKVTENSVVCIIEAMKIMNEIQSELKGTVLEILVENGQPVEYGQRLYKLKQS